MCHNPEHILIEKNKKQLQRLQAIESKIIIFEKSSNKQNFCTYFLLCDWAIKDIYKAGLLYSKYNVIKTEFLKPNS